MHLEEVREPRKRDRETRPGWWVEAARREAARIQKRERPVSQMKLASQAGRHVSAIARWESDGGEIDYLSWVGILHLLDLPVDWEPPPPAKAKSR
jgi:hypothetical protein